MTLRIAPLPEPEAPPVPEGGLGALATDRGNLPLDSVDVHAAVTGLVAGIEVVQGFRNPYDVPLEATYIFPLPDRAAVTALRMEAADRVIDGVLKERGQARQDYAAAVAAGRRAAIAEEDRPDVFTMRAGNIMPGERVTIRLTLDQPLPYELEPSGTVAGAEPPVAGAEPPGGAGGGLGRGAATFRFPLVVAPRYIPGAPLDDEAAGSGVAPDTDAVPDASRISPPVLLPGFPDPVRLSISVDIDPAGLELTGVRSALHVVAEEGSGDRATVRLHPGERLNRDFILRLDYAPPATGEAAGTAGAGIVPALALTPDGGPDGGGAGESAEGTFTLTLLPSGTSRPRPRDVVLVLDRSGSMHGWKMIAARRAAGRIVDTLTAVDRFAVLSFDNVIERPRDLGSGLAAGTDRNRFRAIEHLASLDARGGTEMAGPLQEACALLSDPARDRVLVLITDGQVGNEDHILAGLAPRLWGVRVHTVGIDRAVNAGFLHRLAEAGQGRCELVESEDRLDEAMEQIHHRIGSPLVTGLRLEGAGLEIVPETVAPHRVGALYPGVPLVVSGRFRGAPSGGVVVRGTTPEGEGWERRATGTVTRAPAATSIWARAHLRDLEDRYAVEGSESLERRIVGTSLRFGVLCRFTAFVAVDSRVVAEGGRPHQVVQPVETPDGWSAVPAAPAVAAAVPFAAGPRSMPPPAGAAPGPMAAMPRPEAAPAPPPPGSAGGYGAAPPPPAQPGAAPVWGSDPGMRRRSAPARGTGRGPGPAGRPGGRPRPAPVPSPSEQALADARRRLTALLEELRTQWFPQGAPRRAHLFATVLPALETVTRAMESSGVDAALVAPLSALVNDLHAAGAAVPPCPDHAVDELRDRTLQVLETFLQQGTGESGGTATRRSFWKRPR
ncbi:VIT domain-containing protein [Actinomadura viridis]|uniref:VIT domain-containing protein n=1 Tax=Actinomadura viridis TaxID=58110 RepID=UPI00369448A1